MIHKVMFIKETSEQFNILLIHFRNQWALFRPKTNVLWVCYLLKDLIKGRRSHKKLADILKVIKECSFCVDMFKFF